MLCIETVFFLYGLSIIVIFIAGLPAYWIGISFILAILACIYMVLEYIKEKAEERLLEISDSINYVCYAHRCGELSEKEFNEIIGTLRNEEEEINNNGHIKAREDKHMILTLSEILDLTDDWDNFCEKKGFCVWSVNEGGGDHEVELTKEEAIEFGIIREPSI